MATQPPTNVQLTRQEQQVLFLVAQGWTNRRIRAQLRLTHKALIQTLTSLYQKTGIRQPHRGYVGIKMRQELVEWAHTFFDRGTN
jgi:DNA-binding NarL/FixJ family response regulator